MLSYLDALANALINREDPIDQDAYQLASRLVAAKSDMILRLLNRPDLSRWTLDRIGSLDLDELARRVWINHPNTVLSSNTVGKVDLSIAAAFVPNGHYVWNEETTLALIEADVSGKFAASVLATPRSSRVYEAVADAFERNTPELIATLHPQAIRWFATSGRTLPRAVLDALIFSTGLINPCWTPTEALGFIIAQFQGSLALSPQRLAQLTMPLVLDLVLLVLPDLDTPSLDELLENLSALTDGPDRAVATFIANVDKVRELVRDIAISKDSLQNLETLASFPVSLLMLGVKLLLEQRESLFVLEHLVPRLDKRCAIARLSLFETPAEALSLSKMPPARLEKGLELFWDEVATRSGMTIVELLAEVIDQAFKVANLSLLREALYVAPIELLVGLDREILASGPADLEERLGTELLKRASTGLDDLLDLASKHHGSAESLIKASRLLRTL